MLDFLKSCAIPYILLSKNGVFISEDFGILFYINDKNFTFDLNKDFYSNLIKTGWDITPRGYPAYTIIIDDYKIIFTGFKVRDFGAIRGKDLGTPYIFYDMKQVENYIKSFFSAYRNVSSNYNKHFQDFSHELKNITHHIYDKADLLVKNEQNADARIFLLENIKALAQLLNIKADLMDFLSMDDNRQIPMVIFSPYKKFDKIKRCLEHGGYNNNKLNVIIHINGNSVKTIEGVSGFEMIPYLLLENAIKYTVGNQDIDIFFNDARDGIEIKVQNMGPSLDPVEKEHIFDKGYRGNNAKKRQVLGSGYGLYVVKKLVEQVYGGTVHVDQDFSNTFMIDNTKYVKICFSLFIPYSFS